MKKDCIPTTIIIPAKIDWLQNQLKLNPSWQCQFFFNSENSYHNTVAKFTIQLKKGQNQNIELSSRGRKMDILSLWILHQVQVWG